MFPISQTWEGKCHDLRIISEYLINQPWSHLDRRCEMPDPKTAWLANHLEEVPRRTVTGKKSKLTWTHHFHPCHTHLTLIQSITLQWVKSTHLLSKSHSIPLCSSYHKTRQENQQNKQKRNKASENDSNKNKTYTLNLYKVFGNIAACWLLSPNSIFFGLYTAVPLVVSQLTRF